MNKILQFWKGHGTKILGFTSGSLSVVAGVSEVIPDAHLKYYMATIGLMTFWRGFTNSTNLQ